MNDPIRLTRRAVLAGAAATIAGTGLACATSATAASAPPASAPGPAVAAGPFELPALPYPADALEPQISSRTLGFHHGKHHKAYVDNANAAIAGTPLASMSPEEIVRRAARGEGPAGLFNNAAQAWNHSFYWLSMKPKGGGEPTGALLELVERDFGSADELRKQLVQAGVSQFASGWAWLVLEDGKLKVTKTPNAETPLTTAATPLLTVDVWEHAYYLDYQNRRKDYLQAWVDRVVDWEFARANLAAATGGK
ncbi:MAG: superoxide dismutase [Myxococcales bacterium]|jgi:Fe-Mn family superoxide dismutase